MILNNKPSIAGLFEVKIMELVFITYVFKLLNGEKKNVTTYISLESAEIAVKNGFAITILHNVTIANPYWDEYLHENPLNFFTQAKPKDLVTFRE